MVRSPEFNRKVLNTIVDTFDEDIINGLIIVLNELTLVKKEYPNSFNSKAEGYGVLKREMFEVDIAFSQEKKLNRIVDEVKQVSQICIRIISELGLDNNTVKAELDYIKKYWGL